MGIKSISFTFLVLSFIANDLFAAQLSAVATAENELDARAEALRQLAESIQVNVSSQTLVSSQFKDDVATQELVDTVKTSSDLTLLGAEVFVMKTKQGYRAEAQLDTEQSFNLYLTKIKAEQVLLDTQIASYKEQTTNLAKFALANEITLQLSSHIKDYLVATMLAVKPDPKQGEQMKAPTWLQDLASKNQWLITLNNFLDALATSDITDPKLGALMLVKGISQQGVFTCPIFQENGSWLSKNNVLSYEIDKKLTQPSLSKKQASFFLIGHANKSTSSGTTISYQLVDTNGQVQHENHINYMLNKPSWQSQPQIENAVLASIAFEFKDKAGNKIPSNITTTEQLYTLVEKNLLNKKQLITEDPCRPIKQLAPLALSNAYGTESLISINISGSLSTFVLRPDPKEHEFALAKVTYKQQNLFNTAQVENRTAVGKKFPVLDPNDALMNAVEIALKKLK